MMYYDVVYADGVAGMHVCRRRRRQNVVYLKVHLLFNNVKGVIQ